MFRSARSIWIALLLAVALALPAFARMSDDETGGGGGGGITILPSITTAASTTVAGFSGYTADGITIQLPPETTIFTAVLMLPDDDMPALVLTGRSSSLHLPGEVLAQYWEAGVHGFAIAIRTPFAAFMIKVELKSPSEVDITF